MNFHLLSSTPAGDGELYYSQIQNDHEVLKGQKEVLFMARFLQDHNVKDILPHDFSIPDPPSYRTEVDRVMLKCEENKSAIVETEFWNSSNQLVRIAYADPDSEPQFSEFAAFSPFATLQEIYCGKEYGGLGLQYNFENNSIVVERVFNGSPAEKAGLKARDVVTHIDGESVAGLTRQQVIEKSRGLVNTKVVLTILRKGQANPMNLMLIREKIQARPAQLESPK